MRAAADVNALEPAHGMTPLHYLAAEADPRVEVAQILLTVMQAPTERMSFDGSMHQAGGQSLLEAVDRHANSAAKYATSNDHSGDLARFLNEYGPGE